MWIQANPHFKGLAINLEAPDGLRTLEVRTNIGPNGHADPYPAKDREADFIDHKLWEFLPIFGVRNDGPGAVSVEVQGDDDETQVNTVYQKVTCCTKHFKTATFEDAFEMTGPLRLQFYAWEVNLGGCDPSAGSGTPRKCNRNGEQLTTEFGQYVHSKPPTSDLDVPFDPQFIRGDVSRNGITVRPNTVTYAIPNLYDAFLSTYEVGAVPQRWSAKHVTGLFQTDWFFASLLREIDTDIHGLRA